MNDNLSSNQRILELNPESEDSVDLSQITGALFRHKSLIAKIAIASVVLSCIYAFTRKPIWQGQFEIVLATNQSPTSQSGQLLQTNPNLARLIGASGGSNQLKQRSKFSRALQF